MTLSQKIKLSLVVVAILAAIVYAIFDPEGIETLGACLFLGFMLLVGWANCSSPADRSRDTVDWEMEQERREKEKSDEAIRQCHRNRH